MLRHIFVMANEVLMMIDNGDIGGGDHDDDDVVHFLDDPRLLNSLPAYSSRDRQALKVLQRFGKF